MKLTKQTTKQIKRCCIKIREILFFLLISWMASSTTYADGIIPISGEDQTASGTSFAQTVVTIFQKEILPLIELVGAATLLYYALSGLWRGYRDYHQTHDMGELKSAVIAAVFLIVVGGAILYLMDMLRNHTFS